MTVETIISTADPVSKPSLSPVAKVPGRTQGENLWFNTINFRTPTDKDELPIRLVNSGYSTLLVYPENGAAFDNWRKPSLRLAWQIDEIDNLTKISDSLKPNDLVASHNIEVLDQAVTLGAQTCLRVLVDDKDSLHRSIDKGKHYDNVMIRFKDPTNIPLELVIASLQTTNTSLIKEISSNEDVDDAVVALGVMEVGADGVMFSPENHETLDQFLENLKYNPGPGVALESATIVESRPVGMGYRSCIDVATLFDEEEGILVGSTSQGGILCCPEVFYLPYMELRPFRVNAGAVHSYVYNSDGVTSYMTELQAGSEIMIVNRHGQNRRAVVGRMKTEVRPLRLLVAEFADGEKINVLMQDDWHVRVFSPNAKPLNITELKAGDTVLAHKASPGRHVGIKVTENIKED